MGFRRRFASRRVATMTVGRVLVLVRICQSALREVAVRCLKISERPSKTAKKTLPLGWSGVSARYQNVADGRSHIARTIAISRGRRSSRCWTGSGNPMQNTSRLIKIGGLLFAVSVILAAAESASAQGSSGSGSSGSSSFGTGSSSSSGSSSSTSGNTSGNSSSGIGLTANTPITRSATGNTNQASSTGFVGGNSAQTFVGGSRQATQNQGQNRQFQAFQPSQTTQSTQTQTGTARQVRTSLRMAFAFPAATVAQQTGTLSSSNSVSLSQFATNRPELAGISVNLSSSGEAVLTGTVVSTEASRLAANLVRLQPGVRKVDNQLGVGQ